MPKFKVKMERTKLVNQATAVVVEATSADEARRLAHDRAQTASWKTLNSAEEDTRVVDLPVLVFDPPMLVFGAER